jgi:aryl-alcohol dehydrogenase-like predicted oxidoreductase
VFGRDEFWGRDERRGSIRIVHAALDAGINFVDTANVYNAGQSEVVVGKALEGRRDKVFLATKVHGKVGDGPNDSGNSRLHILWACEDSLRRLHTDWIDLYQIHRPSPDIPIDETLGALTDLVRAGKVRYVGCSTHPAWMVMEALAASERYGCARYVGEQPPYNLLDRRIENELVPLALRYNLALIPWAPLAQGLLAGRYAAGVTPDTRAEVVCRELCNSARRRGSQTRASDPRLRNYTQTGKPPRSRIDPERRRAPRLRRPQPPPAA